MASSQPPKTDLSSNNIYIKLKPCCSFQQGNLSEFWNRPAPKLISERSMIHFCWTKISDHNCRPSQSLTCLVDTGRYDRFAKTNAVFFVKLRTHTSENSCYHTLRRGSTKCENSNTCTRITNHELVECHTVSIYAWYQMIGHVVQSRNQFPHLCVQVFKLPVTICQL